MVLWKLPQYQVAGYGDSIQAKDILELENKFRIILAQILGGIILLVGLYFAWRRIEIAQEGQVTERFTRAIDQLGKVELPLQLGGIYALERIARDSGKDHWPIMEVLTAYVRRYAPCPPPTETLEAQLELGEEDTGAQTEEGRPEKKIKPRPDIQAILTVISRRKRTYGKGEEQQLDLRGTDLRGAVLSEAHLEGATLWDAHLEGASLVKASLGGVDFYKASLGGVDLSSTFGLTREQIDLARTDENTKLPDYLQEPSSEEE